MQHLFKFCVVGASSTVINQGILAFLLRAAPNVPWYIWTAVAFLFGVVNGFYWNRRWTFAGQDMASSKKQFPKFVATNLIGLLLNTCITKGFLILFTGQLVHGANPNPNTVQIAQLCAIPLVTIWNFSASRFWTFKQPKPKHQVPIAE